MPLSPGWVVDDSFADEMCAGMGGSPGVEPALGDDAGFESWKDSFAAAEADLMESGTPAGQKDAPPCTAAPPAVPDAFRDAVGSPPGRGAASAPEVAGDAWKDVFASAEGLLRPAGTPPEEKQALLRVTAQRANSGGELVLCPGFGFTTAAAAKAARRGDGNTGVAGGTGDMGNGNMDKRKCRQLNRDAYVAAIGTHRAEPPPAMGSSSSAGSRAAGVSAWVRKRPLLPHEEAKGEYDAITVRDGARLVTTHCCLLKPDLRRMFMRHATFQPSGGVFDEATASADVYAAAGGPLVDLALRGGRGTLVLYGQTGSGKTMTLAHMQRLFAAQLFGERARAEGDEVCEPPLGGKAGGLPAAAAVEVTAIEVLGKKCVDLHRGGDVTLLQAGAKGAVTIRGAEPFVARGAEELDAHITRLLKSRTTEATSINSTSSRSHALISLRVGNLGASEGRLTLLDCAGSEWAADNASHNAQRRREGAEINASLHALKQCVRAHADKLRNPRGKGHVPYRDAPLTRLLRDSFEADGVDTKFVVIGCVAPGAADTEHSTSTMRTLIELSGAKGDECKSTTQDVPRLRKKAPADAPRADPQPQAQASEARAQAVDVQ